MKNLEGAEEKLARALGPNVALKWIGKPCRELIVRPIDAALIPFSLLWLTFAIFWETMAIDAGAPIFFRIWGVPFVLFGLFIFIGRFIADAYFRSRTVYGISERDAYIVRDGFIPRVATFNLRSTVPIEMKPGRDGTGTLSFGQGAPMNGMSIWDIGSMREFVGIPDVSKVYRLVTGVAVAASTEALERR